MIAADVEELVVAYLAQSFANVGLDLPPEPPTPFYLVNALSGPGGWIDEKPVVSVHVFARTRTAAAEAARALALVMNPWTLNPMVPIAVSTGTVGIDRLQVQERPSWQPYEDPNLQRYCARYKITLRVNQTS